MYDDDQFVPLPQNFPELRRIRDYYGISEESLPDSLLMVRLFLHSLSSYPLPLPQARNAETANVIYLVSPAARAVLLGEDVIPANATSAEPVAGCRLRVVNAGVRLFERERQGALRSADCDYRLSQDGVALLAPVVMKRKFASSYSLIHTHSLSLSTSGCASLVQFLLHFSIMLSSPSTKSPVPLSST